MHYKPTLPTTGLDSATDRFWSYVLKGEDCWTWVGEVNQGGYGRLWNGERRVAAHRFAYELMVGPVPSNLQMDHLCRNRACVNPAHLEPVPCRVNLMRGQTIPAANAAKTHCARCGSLLVPRGNTGMRKCQPCATEHTRAYRARLRSAT